MTDASNPAERSRWNDERWTTFWPKRERFTEAVTPHLLQAAALASGERVLDIGSGGGGTSIEAGRVVGPQGSVVGADISVALCNLARRRAGEAGARNVTFDIVDMQHDAVAGDPFDVAISQFGVMFFDEPVTAFTNIARHLRSGGRLAFACWQAADGNPGVVAVVLAPFLPAAPPPPPGKSPTGPFALADAERTAGILRAAGLERIERTPIDLTVDVSEDAVIDDDQMAFMGIAEADMPAARAAVERHMERFRIGPDLARFPLSLQIFAARRP